jgi:hypothetical protein
MFIIISDHSATSFADSFIIRGDATVIKHGSSYATLHNAVVRSRAVAVLAHRRTISARCITVDARIERFWRTHPSPWYIGRLWNALCFID